MATKAKDRSRKRYLGLDKMAKGLGGHFPEAVTAHVGFSKDAFSNAGKLAGSLGVLGNWTLADLAPL